MARINWIRISYHLLFWIVYLLLNGLVVCVMEGRNISGYLLQATYREAFSLPVKLAFTYFIFYFIIPLYLDRSKLGKLVVMSLLSFAIATLLYRLLLWGYFTWIQPVPFGFFRAQGMILSVFDLYITITSAVIIKMIKLRYKSQEVEETLIKEKLQSELSFLRAQTNPHFLFNTLNNLFSVAQKNNDEETARGIAKLAELMRYLLHESNKALIPLEQVIIEAFERIENTMPRGARITGTETGFRDLDTLTSGLHGGQLIIIAARPAMGKTSLVLNLTGSAAESSKKPVLFFSLEMPRVELANRLMCAEARIDQSRLRSNMLTQDDMTTLTAAANKLHTLPIYIDDSGDLTLLELRAKARRIKADRDMSLIVIDYLQLMKASREKQESREREISEISRGLKGLAKELDVPIVALSQLNRGCETRPGKDKRPMLADLRESGAIEQDADVVMFIYRDEVYNRDTEDKGIAELIIAKQRNGPTDTVRLRFIRELTKFENLAADDRGYGDTVVGGMDEFAGGDPGP